MFFKLKLSHLPLALIYFISSACIAQYSGFGTGSTSTQQSQPYTTTNTTRTLTPDQYSNMVNSLGNQNQESLTQSVKSEYSKRTIDVPPVTTTSTPAAGTVTTQTNITTSPAPTTPVISTPTVNPVVQPTTTPAVNPVVQPTTPGVATTPQTIQKTATPNAGGTPANTPSNQPYTGFGNFGNPDNKSGTNNNTNSNSTGNSGGWNINY